MKFSILSLLCVSFLLLIFGCLEREELAVSSSSINNDEFIRSHSLDQSITANNKARVDTSLFNTSLLTLKVKSRLEKIQFQHAKSSNTLSPDETGYPVWGAITEIGDVSIIPTLRPNLNFSYEFLAVLVNDLQQYEFIYFNGLKSEEPANLIDALTFPILTEQSKEELYGLGSINITDLDIETGGGVSAGHDDPNDCIVLRFTLSRCISVSQEGVGELCCRCEDYETASLRCNGGGGGGGGGGGTNTNSNNGPNPGIASLVAYLDSMRNVAPDQITNNVDCAAEPCLCEVINQFSENPSNFENLSNEVSQLLQSIFDIPNYIDLTITTSDVEGITMDPTTIAQHGLGLTGTNFPISGFAYSEITFNSNYQLNCTQAHLAATLLHESIHAYIEVQRAALFPVDFNRMYPLYSSEFSIGDAHHVTMANQFIVALSQSLHNMFPDLTDEFVEALTWQGLERTDAYDDLIASKPTGFRERIEEINNIASCRGTDVFSPLELNAMGLESCF